MMSQEKYKFFILNWIIVGFHLLFASSSKRFDDSRGFISSSFFFFFIIFFLCWFLLYFISFFLSIIKLFLFLIYSFFESLDDQWGIFIKLFDFVSLWHTFCERGFNVISILNSQFFEICFCWFFVCVWKL
jgi:hypothetical protein